jgi:chemotaxis protein methyltransferase CheR
MGKRMLNAPAELGKQEFRLFQNYIQENSGIYFDDNKKDSLRVSLYMRMNQNRLKSYHDYYQILISPDKGEKEFRELLNLITVNETHFFRNKPQFDALRKVILPDIIKRKEKTDRSICIWSAGCSTGEEPYSIAITLLEILKAPETWRIEIFASDVSRKALAVAEQGIYSARSLRDTDDVIVKKYFQKEDEDKYRLDEKVKKMVSFDFHNLVKELYPASPHLGGWDIIFCRNVLIYFKTESVREVIDNLYNSLSNDGYLFLGDAEMLYQISDKFEPVELGGAFVYCKGKERFTVRPVEKIPFKEFGEVSFSERTLPIKEKPLVKEVVKGRKEQGESYYQAGYEYYKRENFERAQSELIKAVRLNPDNAKAHLLLGNIYVNQSRYSEAEEEIQQVLERDIFLPEAYFLLGVVFEKKGLIDEAIRELKKAIYLDKDFVLAHLNLAHIYKARKMTKEAVRAYQNAVRSLRHKPLTEWIGLSGGFLSEVLMETCKRDIQQIKQR